MFCIHLRFGSCVCVFFARKVLVIVPHRSCLSSFFTLSEKRFHVKRFDARDIYFIICWIILYSNQMKEKKAKQRSGRCGVFIANICIIWKIYTFLLVEELWFLPSISIFLIIVLLQLLILFATSLLPPLSLSISPSLSTYLPLPLSLLPLASPTQFLDSSSHLPLLSYIRISFVFSDWTQEFSFFIWFRYSMLIGN